MRVYHKVLYLSQNAPIASPDIPQLYWDARKFTRAVKSARINKWCHVPDGFYNHRIDENNVDVARKLFGTWLLRVVRKEMPDCNVVLVPVPSKDAIVGGNAPFRSTEMLANALPRHAPEIFDVLRFTRVLQKASVGGPRHHDQLYPAMTVVGQMPNAPIVLVDDVTTMGGHLKAAKHCLEDFGGNVVLGIVCGKTVWDVAANPWAGGYEELVDCFPF